ncbi:PIN domain-containing protein [Corallococcus exercitus]|uniref:PIN domain-containing protein n=1 Tax=Corallococcus exercitus TaxID=2316736 RepID=UPI0035D4B7C0
MRVFVETNFVLEMAFEHAQSQACEGLVRHAEAGDIQLVIPAFCFIEPADTLRRRIHAHKELQGRLEEEQRSRRDTASFTEAQGQAWDVVIGSLVKSTQEARSRVKSIRARLLNCAEVVPVSGDVITRAASFQQENIDLHFPDAVVLASVMTRLTEDTDSARPPSVFLNRNKTDFSAGGIKRALKERHCRLITSFDDGLSAIRAGLHFKPA